jgi:hypothetical protein
VLIFLRHSPLYPADAVDELAVTDCDGNVLPVVREDQKVTNSAKVVRLRISATQGSFTIAASAGTTKASATFRIVRTRPIPRVAETEATDLLEVTYRYASGCPSSDGFILHVIPKAVAYKVTSGDKVWIVPDLSRDYGGTDGHGVIVTGSMACQDFSIPDARPFEMEFSPLAVDGSEGPSYSPHCRQTSANRVIKNAKGWITGESKFECSSAGQVEFSGKVKRQH